MRAKVRGRPTDWLAGNMASRSAAAEGAGYTVEIGTLSAALSASIYRICELIKTAARWRIMKKI